MDILKIGRSRVIVPHGKRWDDLFLHGPRVSDDFHGGARAAGSEGLIVVTNNMREFARMPGVRLENWV